MILFFGMQLIPLGYGLLYLVHSAKKKRRGQMLSVAVLLLSELAVCGILLWEFLKLP